MDASETYPLRKYYDASEVGPSPVSATLDENLQARYAADLQKIVRGEPRALRTTQQRVHAQLERDNTRVRQQLQRALKKEQPQRPLKESSAQALREELENDPIVGSSGYAHYQARDIGYCFGRAAYVHLRLSQKGIPQKNMVKIFAFGQLRHSSLLWEYHMATAVIGERGKNAEPVWWVIDSLFPRVLSVEDWMKRVATFSVLKHFSDVRFYVTDPRKFLPAFGEYRRENIDEKEYRGYFRDLMRSLEEKAHAS